MEYFKELENFIAKLPGTRIPIGKGQTEEGLWWIKFSLEIDHPLTWRVVQELGHLINYLSLNERLPTVFYPVSPPPYMNGLREGFPGPLTIWRNGNYSNTNPLNLIQTNHAIL